MSLSVDNVVHQVRAEHNTTRYKGNDLIVRRGLPVRLETRATSLTFKLVSANPRRRLSGSYEFTLAVNRPQYNWKLQTAPNGIVMVHIPSNAIIGLYEVSTGSAKINMYVLFNPFSKMDQVYMEGKQELDEYVLNDQGRIWVGSHTSPGSIPWNYSQFRNKVLLCALSLVDRMKLQDRHDVIKVTRHLSAMINVQDDNGVLVGRWDGNYRDGTSPSAWTGSAAILLEFYDNGRPVRYGQCWVFAGLLTSVMRSIGIPSRTVTNFVSAHDTNRPYNRSVDKYYNALGAPIESMSSDSIWNFHVWSSAWMRRPDLQKASATYSLNFDGWQAVDATPQEQSTGLYQMGPSSVVAVKHGYSLDYDTDFVIGEVNADVLHFWAVEGSREFVVRQKYQRHVGQKISTKAVGSDSRNDITLEYKFAEGTPEERASLAGRPSGSVQPVRGKDDVEFSVESPESVKVGQPIVFTVKAKNNRRSLVVVHFNVLYRGTDYTGTPRARIGSSRQNVKVQGGASGEFKVEVTASQYEPILSQGVQTIQFNTAARVAETGQTWSFESLVLINASDMLKLSAPEKLPLGGSAVATAEIKNVTNMQLTDVQLRVEGEDLTELQVIELGSIDVKKTVFAKVNIKAEEEGEKLLVATLDTAELKDMSTAARVVVHSKEDTTTRNGRRSCCVCS